MSMKNFMNAGFFNLLLFTAVSCSGDWSRISPDEQGTDNSGETGNSGTVNSGDFENSITDALASNSQSKEEKSDYEWNSTGTVRISLNRTSISVNGTGVSVNGSVAEIFTGGTYYISGVLDNGQIRVNAGDDDIVRLIFDGVAINNSENAPVNIANAGKAIILLADNSENYLSDSTPYVFEDPDEDEPNATLFSKDYLAIGGNGSLTVYASYNDAIAGKDGLVIKSGTINIRTVDDGIRGKDFLIIHGGNITVDAGGDGLKSNNDEDNTKGYIYIETCSLEITSGRDAVQAETDVLIIDGVYRISSGGGSNFGFDEAISAKGIKASVNVIIDNGNYVFNSSDDALHSNGNLAINGGSYSISTGDDGIHADATLGINDGNFIISKSFEGIESAVITINGGNFNIVSSDDGLNVAGGNDGSGMNRPGFGGFNSSSNYYLYINGGYFAINAYGDGIDVNGAIEMTGGKVIITGPTSNMNSALDYDVSFKLTGGYLLGTGSAGMAQAPGTSSTQYSLLCNFTSIIPGNSIVAIRSDNGEDILVYAPEKKYQSVVFSSPDLNKGSSYTIYTGGSSTGQETDGLYAGGTYTPGTKFTSFTVSGTITKVNSR